MILEAKNISFSYPKTNVKVLDNISIAVKPGEKIGIFAPSGIGKTTLCKILSGYEFPDKGNVFLDNKPLPKKAYCPVQLIWQHPEQVANPKLRMKDILLDVPNLPDYVISKLGIKDEWLNRFPNELSGGELQRFCIARALSLNTKFLIADEITTMLDLITQSQLWHFLLDEIQKRNIGLVAVSHDISLLEKVTDKIIYLKREEL